MKQIDLFRIFLIFLEMQGVLEDYQRAMNGKRWHHRNPYSIKDTLFYYESKWVVNAFRWASHGGRLKWEPIHDKWLETLDKLNNVQ